MASTLQDRARYFRMLDKDGYACEQASQFESDCIYITVPAEREPQQLLHSCCP